MIALFLIACLPGLQPSEDGRQGDGVDSAVGIAVEDSGLAQAEPSPSSSEKWVLKVWEASCSQGEQLSTDLEIPKGTLITSYLLLSDGYGLEGWTDAREGVLRWGRNGLSVNCEYQGSESENFQVKGARLVWAVLE